MALTATRDGADYFEAVVAALAAQAIRAPPLAKPAANWIMGDLVGAVEPRRPGDRRPRQVSAARCWRGLVERIADGTLSGKIARDMFQALWPGRRRRQRWSRCGRRAAAVDHLIDDKGLRQISDSAALEPLVDEVLAGNDKSVQEFRAGKEKAFNALVGQVMKASRGKANPQQVDRAAARPSSPVAGSGRRRRPMPRSAPRSAPRLGACLCQGRSARRAPEQFAQAHRVGIEAVR